MLDDSDDFFEASTDGAQPRAPKVTLARVLGVDEGKTYRTIPFRQQADTRRKGKPHGTKRGHGA